jgi:ribonuclease R/exosome complex exonuclease DIS3/RRP44
MNRNKKRNASNKIENLSQNILAILRKDHSQSFNFKQIAAKLNVDDANSRNQIIKELKELQGNKTIQELDRGKYILTPNQNYYTGRVDIAGRGQGYIIVEELEDDILVKNKNLNKALNGDTVEVYVYKRKRGGKSEGEITKIIERKRTEFVGTINIQDRFAFV